MADHGRTSHEVYSVKIEELGKTATGFKYTVLKDNLGLQEPW